MAQTVYSAALFLAILFLSFLAARTFSRRQIQFAGAPAVPSVLTSRLGFSTGMLAYGSLLLIFYLLVTYYWGPLRRSFGPIISSVPFFKPLAPLLDGQHDDAQGEIISWIVAVLVTFIFTWDVKYNPFAIVLEGVLDLLRIPERAISVFEALKVAKFGRLDDARAAEVAEDSQILACDSAYFAADRRDLEYRWAHICYLRYVLLEHLRDARYQRFFAKQSIQWSELDAAYRSAAIEVAAWLAGPRDYRDAFELLGKLSALKDRHYRAIACLAVTTSASVSEIWQRISDISRSDVGPGLQSLARYIVLFPPLLLIAIFLGRELSTAFYIAAIGPDPRLHNLDIDKFKFWFVVSLFVYSVPIALSLITRALLRSSLPYGAQRYWLLYGLMFLLGYLVAMLSLSYISAPGSVDLATAAYWRFVYDHELIWPLMPGFVTAFVSYRLDSRASCKDAHRAGLLDRAEAAMLCGAAGLLISVLGCLGTSTLSPGESFVVIGTTTVVGGVAGWLSRFETS
ncbi:MAG: hypothetical protein U1E53_03425 [Dongiaceae bacterium]